jgi:hypothetical protein
MKQIAATLLALALVGASSAAAQEAIQTHSGESPAGEASAQPKPGPDRDPRQANGDWARRVMAGVPTEESADDLSDGKGCRRNLDRNLHGEVWAGVGTGGYNTVGAIVTQPLGDCAEVTVAVSRTDNGRVSRRRR